MKYAPSHTWIEAVPYEEGMEGVTQKFGSQISPELPPNDVFMIVDAADAPVYDSDYIVTLASGDVHVVPGELFQALFEPAEQDT